MYSLLDTSAHRKPPFMNASNPSSSQPEPRHGLAMTALRCALFGDLRKVGIDRLPGHVIAFVLTVAYIGVTAQASVFVERMLAAGESPWPLLESLSASSQTFGTPLVVTVATLILIAGTRAFVDEWRQERKSGQSEPAT